MPTKINGTQFKKNLKILMAAHIFVPGEYNWGILFFSNFFVRNFFLTSS